MGHFASKKVLYVTLEGVETEKPAAGVEWIAIRAALTLGQRTQMQGALFEIDGEKGKAQANMGRYLAAFNEMAIVDWYLVEDGEPVPFSRERIADLDPNEPLVDKAMAEFAERNPLASARSGGKSG